MSWAAMDVFAVPQRSTHTAPDDVFSKAYAAIAVEPDYAVSYANTPVAAPSAAIMLQPPLPPQVTSRSSQTPPVSAAQPQTPPAPPADHTLSTTSTAPPPRLQTSRNAHSEGGSVRVDAIQSHAVLAVTRARAHLTSERSHTMSSPAHISVNETVQRGRDVLSRAQQSRRPHGLGEVTEFDDFDSTPDASVDVQPQQPPQPHLSGWGTDISAAAPPDAAPPAVAFLHSQHTQPMALNSLTGRVAPEFSRSGGIGVHSGPISDNTVVPNQSLRNYSAGGMAERGVYQTHGDNSRRQLADVDVFAERAPLASPLLHGRMTRSEGSALINPLVPSLPSPQRSMSRLPLQPEPEPEPGPGPESVLELQPQQPQQPPQTPQHPQQQLPPPPPLQPAPRDESVPLQMSSRQLEYSRNHGTLHGSLTYGTTRGTVSSGAHWRAVRGAVSASISFNSMSMPPTYAVSEDSSDIDESEIQLSEEIEESFAFDDPHRFRGWDKQSSGGTDGACTTVSAGAHDSAASHFPVGTDWEGPVWVKYRPLARTTSKPPQWCAVLTAHELKIYDCPQHKRRTKIPWKTVHSDEVTYAGCTDVSVQLHGRRKKKSLQITAADAQLDAVSSFARSVRERTPWRGPVLRRRSQPGKPSKCCSCEIEVCCAASEQNTSEATGAMTLLVHRVEKKTKQTSVMDIGIGHSPEISQIRIEGVTICLQNGTRLRISAGRVHTETFWNALSNGLCAPWLRRRTQADASRDTVVQRSAFYSVEAESVAVETPDGDRNGMVFSRGDRLQCLQSAISPQGTRRILTNSGWVPTDALSLVLDS